MFDIPASAETVSPTAPIPLQSVDSAQQAVVRPIATRPGIAHPTVRPPAVRPPAAEPHPSLCSSSGPSESKSPSSGKKDTDALAAEITTLAGHLNAAQYRFLKLLDEFDREQGWAGPGVRSLAHWLSWKCGIGELVAREKVRVARALRELPMIDASFERGEISYSKVRAMTRAATPENEAQLLNIARHGTAEHMERLVRVYRRCRKRAETSPGETERRREERFYCFDEDEETTVFGGRVSAERGRSVDEARVLPRRCDGRGDGRRMTDDSARLREGCTTTRKTPLNQPKMFQRKQRSCFSGTPFCLPSRWMPDCVPRTHRPRRPDGMFQRKHPWRFMYREKCFRGNIFRRPVRCRVPRVPRVPRARSPAPQAPPGAPRHRTGADRRALPRHPQPRRRRLSTAQIERPGLPGLRARQRQRRASGQPSQRKDTPHIRTTAVALRRTWPGNWPAIRPAARCLRTSAGRSSTSGARSRIVPWRIAHALRIPRRRVPLPWLAISIAGPMPTTSTTAEDRLEQLQAEHSERGVEIDKSTAVTRWAGERMDYSTAIEWLLNRDGVAI